MEKDEKKLLINLKKDLNIYKDSIKEVSDEILENHISKYPVFVAHQNLIDLGKPILDKEELMTSWSVNATILEEFISKKLIAKDKIEDFKKVYKDPQKYMCLFVVDEKGGRFVFAPYNEENRDAVKKN